MIDSHPESLDGGAVILAHKGRGRSEGEAVMPNNLPVRNMRLIQSRALACPDIGVKWF